VGPADGIVFLADAIGDQIASAFPVTPAVRSEHRISVEHEHRRKSEACAPGIAEAVQDHHAVFAALLRLQPRSLQRDAIGGRPFDIDRIRRSIGDPARHLQHPDQGDGPESGESRGQRQQHDEREGDGPELLEAGTLRLGGFDQAGHFVLSIRRRYTANSPHWIRRISRCPRRGWGRLRTLKPPVTALSGGAIGQRAANMRR
jgi:hypothetical protein